MNFLTIFVFAVLGLISTLHGQPPNGCLRCGPEAPARAAAYHRDKRIRINCDFTVSEFNSFDRIDKGEIFDKCYYMTVKNMFIKYLKNIENSQ